MFEYNLITNKENARAELVVLTIMIVPSKVTGLAKLGMIPGGGVSNVIIDKFMLGVSEGVSMMVVGLRS